ncbi:MAG TPA: DUF899 family protein [Burkholderiales bacterium]|nr:DUF899 family protein [Burkholderiales bacterium]
MAALKFPNETKQYRTARKKLLDAEIALRRQIEKVAALRRKLPSGGELAQDYVFTSQNGPVKLSELFERGNTLLAYSFMFGPQMKNACPMCTSFLDGLNGNAQHIAQRTNLVVIAKSPIERLLEYARGRDWCNLRLLSSAGTSYNRDYYGENDKGAQLPMMNVFVKRDGKVRHFYGSEVLYAPEDKGQNARHNDLMWPLWNVLDLTPEGRGSDWYPKLSY